MTNTPYTTAASDFLKYVEYREDEKSSLIDYAATDFLSLKASLINYLKAVYPLDYNNFSESDLGVMFIELVSYMGAVMSMKTDMIAHEMFLKTSKNPNNVRKLLDLIGVKLRGPSSSAAMTTLTADTALTGAGESLTVQASDRVVTAVSPLDGQSVSYTLYPTNNGSIENPLKDASIKFYYEDSNGGQTWENAVFVEGAFAVDRGTFSEVDVLKSISLSKSPVVDGSVQVFIDSGSGDTSGVYREVDSLFSASGSDDKIFRVAYGNNYDGVIEFGDGVAGALPPAGAEYTVTYRVGGGERGNNNSNVITATINTVEGNSLAATNTQPFTGGADAESVDHAKKYGKLVYRQQDRLVSLDDFIAFANTYKGPLGTSAKATAVTRKAFGSANIIDVYLLEKASNLQLQKASIAFKQAMLSAMEEKKMLTDEIVLVDGLVRTLDIDLRISLDRRFQNQEESLKNKISNIVTTYFNVDNRDFGESFFPADIAREVFTNVPEIRIAEVTNYKDSLNLEINEILQLNNFSLNFNYV